MTTFRDNEGRKWSLRITVQTVRRLRDEIDFNLLESAKYREAVADPVLCGQVVYRALSENAERKVSEDAFLSSIAGDVIDDMRAALASAVISFFPRSLQAAAHEGSPSETPPSDGTTSSGGAPASSA